MIETIAAVLPRPQAPIQIEKISLPDPSSGEVLVRMEACGLCHSDLMIAGLEKLPASPLVLGHEGIGRVEAVGAGVTGLATGDRVVITFLASTCGKCELCADERQRFCAAQHNHGYTRHGALAEYAVAPAQYLVRVPDSLPAENAAPLCCAGWTAYGAIREAGLREGQTIGLFGIGGLGHLGVQYARAKGLKVAAVDVAEDKLQLARELGADVGVVSQNAGRTLLKQQGGVDAAVVFSAAPEAAHEALRAVRRTGTLVLVGLATRPWEMPISEAVLKGVTIKGSYLGARADLEEVFRLAGRGIGRAHVETHPLADTPILLDRMRAGRLTGRAVVQLGSRV